PRGSDGIAAGDVLEDDPAATLAKAVGEQAERGLDAVGVVVCRNRQVLHRERSRGDHEQRFERPRQAVDRVGGDQAERAIHAPLPSTRARETLIGANGRPWASETSPMRASSSSARKATTCSTRESPSTSVS